MAIPVPPAMQRLAFLDVVRVVAVLSIILFHFHPTAFLAGAPPETVPVLTLWRQPLGDLGVTLFIIVSATALMTSNANRFSVSDFYVKRFLAIFPSYWIAYVAVAVMLLASRGNWAAGLAAWKFPFTVLGLDGFLFHDRTSYYLVGEWFVGFILCLYVIFPLLRRGVKDQPLVTASVVGILFAVFHHYYGRFFTLLENRNPLMRLPEFFFGLCFLHYVRPHRWIGGPTAALALLLFAFWTPPLSMQVYGILLGLACFCVLAYAAEGLKMPERCEAFFAAASKYSFLAFLVHHQIIDALRAKLATPIGPVKTAALFLAVVMASFATARLLLPLVDRLTALLRQLLQPGETRQRTVLAGATALLVLLVGGLAFDLGSRSPFMERKLAALSARVGRTSGELNGMGLASTSSPYAEAGRWMRMAGLGVYGSQWWPNVGTLRYNESARDDRLCTGNVDSLSGSDPNRGARGWVTTSPPAADVLIVLTNENDATVGYGISGQRRPDVAKVIAGARRDSGWIAISDSPPVNAYAYVEGLFCKL